MILPRKKKRESSSERWVVSYADMMTLLFALFVILFAMKQEGVSETVVVETFKSVLSDATTDRLKAYQKLPVEFQTVLEQYLLEGVIDMSVTPRWIEIVVYNENVFGLGSAELNYRSTELLTKISSILKAESHPIVVEGYTDSLPISSSRYPSNWELSSARASSVVRFFERQGIDRDSFMVVGYGARNPIGSNETVEGRSRNRRVIVKILRDI
jgi:chemotaxis protein MotB